MDIGESINYSHSIAFIYTLTKQVDRQYTCVGQHEHGMQQVGLQSGTIRLGVKMSSLYVVFHVSPNSMGSYMPTLRIDKASTNAYALFHHAARCSEHVFACVIPLFSLNRIQTKFLIFP